MPKKSEKHKLVYPQILIELWAPPSVALDTIEQLREKFIGDIRRVAKRLPADWKFTIGDIDDSAEPIEEAIERIESPRSKRNGSRRITITI
jgi:hypothetical protein